MDESGPVAMRRLDAFLNAAGAQGPLLIVAEPALIASLAPAWAAACAAAGVTHRVRLSGGGTSPGEIAAIVDEARSLGARAIMAAGGSELQDSARSAAAAARLLFVPLPAGPRGPVPGEPVERVQPGSPR